MEIGVFQQVVNGIVVIMAGTGLIFGLVAFKKTSYDKRLLLEEIARLKVELISAEAECEALHNILEKKKFNAGNETETDKEQE